MPIWGFRRWADQARLVCGRLSKPYPELCWPSGAGGRWGADGRQYLLQALPGGAAVAVDRARDRRHHHRQPVDHHRCFFDDTAGDPAWVVAETADQATSSEGYGQIYVGVAN